MTATAKKYAQNVDQLASYLSGRGITKGAADGFLLGKVCEPEPGDERFEGRLSLPYVTSAGVVGIKYRCVEDHDCKAAGHAKYDQHSQRAHLYNASVLADGGDVVAICEGECLTPDAEVLTPAGWLKLDNYSGQEVAQYTNGKLEFVLPEAYVRKWHDGEILTFSNAQRYYARVTPQHRLPAWRGDGREDWTTATEGASVTRYVPRVGDLVASGIPLSDAQIALALAVSADAAIDARRDGGRYARFGLKKARKVRRLRAILRLCQITPSDTEIADGYRSICFRLPDWVPGRLLPTWWITSATTEQRRLMLNELVHWDGNRVKGRRQTEYASKHRQNAEWVQTLAHVTGCTATVMQRHNMHGEWFKVSILETKTRTSWQSLRTPEREEYAGMVYCVKVPSSAFLVRQGGCISVTGNCDAIVCHSVLGIPAVGTPGTTWLDHFPRCFADFDRVVVIADNDLKSDESNPGVKHARKVQSTISGAELVLPPAGLDLSDWVLRDGADAVRERLMGL